MSDAAMKDAIELLGDLLSTGGGRIENGYCQEGCDVTEEVQRVAERLAKDAATIAALRADIERARIGLRRLAEQLEGGDGRG